MTSTINRQLPADQTPIVASEVRGNFDAAANDIESLQNTIGGDMISPPGTVQLGTLYVTASLDGKQTGATTIDPVNLLRNNVAAQSIVANAATSFVIDGFFQSRIGLNDRNGVQDMRQFDFSLIGSTLALRCLDDTGSLVTAPFTVIHSGGIAFGTPAGGIPQIDGWANFVNIRRNNNDVLDIGATATIRTGYRTTPLEYVADFTPTLADRNFGRITADLTVNLPAATDTGTAVYVVSNGVTVTLTNWEVWGSRAAANAKQVATVINDGVSIVWAWGPSA